ncbi:sodium/potassium/calcium exchanger 1-like [Chaetodon trifascialis]|uniref:sodium/potassium/calcium exchanger 1-like n=1 Tax=Chaetodon trifascialis TaxID=109706 RepID=UPI003996ADAA
MSLRDRMVLNKELKNGTERRMDGDTNKGDERLERERAEELKEKRAETEGTEKESLEDNMDTRDKEQHKATEPRYSKELTVVVELIDFLCRRCGKQGHYASECDVDDQQRGCERGSEETPDEEEGGWQAEGGGREEAGAEPNNEGEDGEQTGAEESDVGGGGSGDQEKEDGVQDGEEEDERIVEETPMGAGGQMEMEEISSSMDGVVKELDGGEERGEMMERRRRGGENGGNNGGTKRGNKGGNRGSRENTEEGGRGWVWEVSDITGSEGDDMDEVADNRKRPLGRKDKRQEPLAALLAGNDNIKGIELPGGQMCLRGW